MKEGIQTRVLDALREFPGVKTSVEEVAVECEITKKQASNHLWNLNRKGLIFKEIQGKGRTRQAHYWAAQR